MTAFAQAGTASRSLLPQLWTPSKLYFVFPPPENLTSLCSLIFPALTSRLFLGDVGVMSGVRLSLACITLI